MNAYSDHYWQTADGLRLHYRDYLGRADRPPIVCLPGLTRNARDFENLAGRLAGEWRVLCPELRGRGHSEYAPDWRTYNPGQYVADVAALFDQIGITRFVAVGTSLGGLMTLMLAMIDNRRIAGALLNDIGPVLEPAGLARIRTYVGQARHFATWDEAASALAVTQTVAYPDYQPADWLAMARRVMIESAPGTILFDYDMQIGQAFAPEHATTGAGPEVDLWPGIAALAGRPVLLVRGSISELLSAATFADMQQRLPDAEAVTLPRIGHAPTLDEPEVTSAITRWLSQVA